MHKKLKKIPLWDFFSFIYTQLNLYLQSVFMKSLISLVFIFLLFSCNEPENKGEFDSNLVNNNVSDKDFKNKAEIKFEEEEFDFGKITQGEQVSHSFKFKNIGGKSLVISGASGSCGCTVPEWPKEPILPGAEGKINVVFNSEGKRDYQEKTISVITNCEPATRILRIKTEIIVAEVAK